MCAGSKNDGKEEKQKKNTGKSPPVTLHLLSISDKISFKNHNCIYLKRKQQEITSKNLIPTNAI